MCEEEKLAQHVIRVGIAAVLGLAVVSAFAQQPNNNPDFRCGVSSTLERGMQSLSAVIESPTTIRGDYTLEVKSVGNAGSTNIKQGGSFSATAGESLTLSKIAVSVNANLSISFVVTSADTRYDCSTTFQRGS
jgi:hypothetical protein